MRRKVWETINQDQPENDIQIKGWVRTRRDSKGFSFMEINDGSCLKNLQVILDADIPSYSVLEDVGTGAAVAVTGDLVESPGKGQKWELRAKEVTLVGKADQEAYPLQKKRHSDEYLRSIAHLRPRTNKYGAVNRIRSETSFAVHKFFHDRCFRYIHTPIITGSDCEGAGEMFQVTALDLDNLPMKEGKVDLEQDFFGRRAALTVSGQLSAESLACALGDVYTFGPTFRAENSNTSRHLAEFWMIEPEMAFCTLEGDMELAEEFIKYILKYVLDHCPEDMDFFSKWIEKGVKESIQQVVDSQFQHVTYSKAVELLEKAERSFEYPIGWGEDLQSEHERYLTEEVFKGPVIVTDYPKEIKAFYMKLNEDNKTVRAMDVLVPRLGEIIGGSEREDHYDTLLKRIEEMNLNPEDYWWYLDLRRYGSVPHSGFGLGFERLVQYVTGMHNIRDVIPFPRTVKNAEF